MAAEEALRLSPSPAISEAPGREAVVVRHSAPVPNGGIVIAAEAQTPDTLNPYLTQTLSGYDIYTAAFDYLVQFDDKGYLYNDLATSYSLDAANPGTISTMSTTVMQVQLIQNGQGRNSISGTAARPA